MNIKSKKFYDTGLYEYRYQHKGQNERLTFSIRKFSKDGTYRNCDLKITHYHGKTINPIKYRQIYVTTEPGEILPFKFFNDFTQKEMIKIVDEILLGKRMIKVKYRNDGKYKFGESFKLIPKYKCNYKINNIIISDLIINDVDKDNLEII